MIDVAVIGGGIVGLSVARELLRRKGRRLVVLEAERQLGEHQTGRNSGVIHSGLYYKPGSLKATLCKEGRDALYRYCDEHGILHEQCGKVVVASHEDEHPALEELIRRAKANGTVVRELSLDELKEREPHVVATRALLVPETGIVSYKEVLAWFARDVEDMSHEPVRMGHTVEAITDTGSAFVIETSRGKVFAKNILNCAGLQSDRIAVLAGLEPKCQILPFRGEYFDLVEDKRHLCRDLVYPVPDARYPFLGVHFTRGVDGEVECGPNAVLALRREGYSKTSFRGRDVVDMLQFLGFWNVVMQHWGTGIHEVLRSLSKARFVKSVQKLVPEVRAEDLVVGKSGVRAQAVMPDGKLVDDFLLERGPRSLHVLNAPSPAATASLAIARVLADRADAVFE